jgi:hypothetical protein
MRNTETQKKEERRNKREKRVDRIDRKESGRQKTRDFTNNIKIAGEIFEIISIKGKKTVVLPWEKLKRIYASGFDENAVETIYKGLKGKIIVKNQFNLLTGEKLELILSLAPVLDIDGAFSNAPNSRSANIRKENFNLQHNLPALIKHLDSLVRPVIWKKNSKDLGFLGLFTDHAGNYWFRVSRGFHTSLNESLSSLDTLIGELGEEIAPEQKHIVNLCYRRLSGYLG